MTRRTARPPADAPIVRVRPARRLWSQAALLAACVLLANGLVGERGLTETIRAKRSFAAAARGLARLKSENDALRAAAQRLRDDAATIELVARGELGLVRRGEILVTVRDLRD